MTKVGIIGTSGYAGAELVRYLLGHPEVKITYLASDTFDCKPLSDAFPSFLGQNLPLCEKYDLEKASNKADFFFTAQGNGGGMKIAPELIKLGKKVIDIPADFRLKNLDSYKQFYGMDHLCPDFLKEAVYGIPELHSSEIAKARIVSNPGCYATSAILALAPFVTGNMVDLKSIIVDSKSGVSGSGRSKLSVDGLFAEINEGFKAYGVATHRHTPEIEQELSIISGGDVIINFTPHLVPMNRGILTTAYANYCDNVPDTKQLIEIFAEFYAGKPFIKVINSQPTTKNVSGTNFVHITAVSDERTGRAIITCAIDNMGKGAAGQAVQNMNLMCGYEETTALMMPAVYP